MAHRTVSSSLVHPARVVALAATVLVLLGCSRGTRGTAPVGDGPPRLLVLSSTIGYVEPCGCTVDLTLGGIDRIAAAVTAERAAGPTAVIVVGPHLFERAPDQHRVAQEEAKARLIGRAFDRIGVDAVVPTATELVRGRPLYDEVRGVMGAPDITANVPDGAGRVLDIGSARVGVFGLVEPGEAVPGGEPSDPRETANREAARLRAAGAQVVVAFAALPRRQIRRMARKVEGVDLWVLGEHPREEHAASPLKRGYLIEAGDRGRNLGRIVLHDTALPGPLTDPMGDAERAARSLDLQIEMAADLFRRTGDENAEQQVATLKARKAELAAPTDTGKRFNYTLVPIAKDITPEETIKGWLAEYNASLKALNLAVAGEIPPVPPGQSGYVGAQVCADCHPDAYDVWKATRHGKAWQTLVDADKTFDAECVSCHVTGWQQPGGSVLGQTDGRVDVQCEVCHGPAQLHVEYGGDPTKIMREAPASLCVNCHNDHHSPKFDYATYLPRILGPGHQRRAAAGVTGQSTSAP